MTDTQQEPAAEPRTIDEILDSNTATMSESSIATLMAEVVRLRSVESARVTDLKETEIRADERHRLADLLESHAETIRTFTDGFTVELCVFLLRLDA